MSVSRLVGGGSCPRQEQIPDRRYLLPSLQLAATTDRTRLDRAQRQQPLPMPLPGARQPRPAGSGSAAAKQV